MVIYIFSLLIFILPGNCDPVFEVQRRKGGDHIKKIDNVAVNKALCLKLIGSKWDKNRQRCVCNGLFNTFTVKSTNVYGCFSPTQIDEACQLYDDGLFDKTSVYTQQEIYDNLDINVDLNAFVTNLPAGCEENAERSLSLWDSQGWIKMDSPDILAGLIANEYNGRIFKIDIQCFSAVQCIIMKDKLSYTIVVPPPPATTTTLEAVSSTTSIPKSALSKATPGKQPIATKNGTTSLKSTNTTNRFNHTNNFETSPYNTSDGAIIAVIVILLAMLFVILILMFRFRYKLMVNLTKFQTSKSSNKKEELGVNIDNYQDLPRIYHIDSVVEKYSQVSDQQQNETSLYILPCDNENIYDTVYESSQNHTTDQKKNTEISPPLEKSVNKSNDTNDNNIKLVQKAHHDSESLEKKLNISEEYKETHDWIENPYMNTEPDEEYNEVYDAVNESTSKNDICGDKNIDGEHSILNNLTTELTYTDSNSQDVIYDAVFEGTEESLYFETELQSPILPNRYVGDKIFPSYSEDTDLVINDDEIYEELKR